MLKAFSTAATGMDAQQTMVDSIANNLANINTNGFKRSQVNFQDLLYLKIRDAGREVSSGVTAPSGLEIGSGVRMASTNKVFSVGEFQGTGRDLDIGIQGDGFLEVTLPNGETALVRPWDVAPTSIQLALARGHRWLAMLESGEAKSLKEIATREGIDNSYVSRMVNLTTLAPDIVAAILDDALPNHITLFDLAVDPPAVWGEQRERAGL